MFKNKTLIITLVAVIAIVLVAFVVTSTKSTPAQVAVGGTSNFDTIGVTGLYVGSSGTTLTGIFTGTCSILANASVAATSTSNFDCVAADAVSGDKVFVAQLASSTLASQYVIKGVRASTTSGFITFSILNLTGTSAVPAATNGFGSSTAYFIVR